MGGSCTSTTPSYDAACAGSPRPRSSSGARTTASRPWYGHAYADAIPGARFQVISEAGHYPEIERPDELYELTLRFLNEVGR